MTATAQRERFLTDNEKYGNSFLDESAPGGVWVVSHQPGMGLSYIAHIFTNRQATEDYIYAKCEEHPGRTPDDYAVQVWQAEDAYDPTEDEA